MSGSFGLGGGGEGGTIGDDELELLLNPDANLLGTLLALPVGLMSASPSLPTLIGGMEVGGGSGSSGGAISLTYSASFSNFA